MYVAILQGHCKSLIVSVTSQKATATGFIYSHSNVVGGGGADGRGGGYATASDLPVEPKPDADILPRHCKCFIASVSCVRARATGLLEPQLGGMGEEGGTTASDRVGRTKYIYIYWTVKV